MIHDIEKEQEHLIFFMNAVIHNRHLHLHYLIDITSLLKCNIEFSTLEVINCRENRSNEIVRKIRFRSIIIVNDGQLQMIETYPQQDSHPG